MPIVIFILFLLDGYGQTLNLVSGKRQKTCKPGSYYKVELASVIPYREQMICDYSELEGTLISKDWDSLTFHLNALSYSKAEGDIIHEETLRSQSGTFKFAFNQNHITSLKNYRSKSSKNNKAFLQGLGGTVIGIGLGLVLIGSKKNFNFSGVNNVLKIQD